VNIKKKSINLKGQELNMKLQIPEKFKSEFIKGNQMLIIFAVVLGIALLTAEFLSKPKQTPTDAFSADTIIPKGYVLIPIELANFQSTSALIGQYGVVDLYLAAKKIAAQIKILRAPLNPNLFAVLVPEHESESILKYAGPFTAVVQNPDSNKNTVIEKDSQKHSRIQYQEGGI
jgi:hypothetical protein